MAGEGELRAIANQAEGAIREATIAEDFRRFLSHQFPCLHHLFPCLAETDPVAEQTASPTASSEAEERANQEESSEARSPEPDGVRPETTQGEPVEESERNTEERERGRKSLTSEEWDKGYQEEIDKLIDQIRENMKQYLKEDCSLVSDGKKYVRETTVPQLLEAIQDGQFWPA